MADHSLKSTPTNGPRFTAYGLSLGPGGHPFKYWPWSTCPNFSEQATAASTGRHRGTSESRIFSHFVRVSQNDRIGMMCNADDFVKVLPRGGRLSQFDIPACSMGDVFLVPPRPSLCGTIRHDGVTTNRTRQHWLLIWPVTTLASWLRTAKIANARDASPLKPNNVYSYWRCVPLDWLDSS